MNQDLHCSPHLRRAIYALLIVLAVGNMIGRIAAVRSEMGGTPLLSANDRSRWSTVRSLVDHGTYEIDEVIFRPDGKRDREWYTIDMVRHRGWDGREHYYSSKPPLLATLVAGPYWLLARLGGIQITEQPFYVVRLLLILVNVVPLVLYFLLLAAVLEQFGGSDWGRLFVMAAATAGTFLTTFAVTLNNHLPAAVSVMVAVFAVLRGWETSGWRWFALAGLASAFAVANELPALSFFALVAAVLLWRNPARTLIAFLPAAVVVAAALMVTTYWAHGSWRPPYAHRQDGPVLASWSADDALTAGPLTAEFRQRLAEAGLELSDRSELLNSAYPERWHLWDPQGEHRFAVVRLGPTVEVRAWDNWYEYENSYWLPGRKSGVDLGERSRVVYAFHVLIGHRGIFSLTPVWLLSVWGGARWLARGDQVPRGLAAATLLLTAVCLAFYLMRPLEDRNYGGVAAGFRWMFWFAPLWLLCAVPAADTLARRRWTRGIGYALLLVSILSATYAGLNPWSHSWIWEYWSELGWLPQSR